MNNCKCNLIFLTKRGTCIAIFLLTLNRATQNENVHNSSLIVSSINEITREHNIRVITYFKHSYAISRHERISGENASSNNLSEVLRIIKDEMSVYKFYGDIILRSIYPNIVICEKLEMEGKWQSALTDHEHKTMYLNAEDLQFGKGVVARNFHHEIFHMIDFSSQDPLLREWNFPTFHNKNGDRVGYISKYAETNQAEDKAELFSYMTLDWAFVEDRAQADIVLQQKVVALSNYLRGVSSLGARTKDLRNIYFWKYGPKKGASRFLWDCEVVF